MKPDVQCCVCLHKFLLVDLQKIVPYECPNCHTPLRPKSLDRNVAVIVNWDDLRVLTNFAHNWVSEKFPSSDAKISVLNIINALEWQGDQLNKQVGAEMFVPLTHERELRKLKKQGKLAEYEEVEKSAFSPMDAMIEEALSDPEEEDDDEDEEDSGGGLGTRPLKHPFLK